MTPIHPSTIYLLKQLNIGAIAIIGLVRSTVGAWVSGWRTGDLLSSKRDFDHDGMPTYR